MEIRKGLISGVVAGIALFFVGWIIEELMIDIFFMPYYEEGSALWNPIGTSIAFQGVVTAIAIGILMGAVYSIFYRAIPSGGIMKGFTFGLIFYLITDIPSYFNIRLFIPIPDEIIIYWLLRDLIEFLVTGVILAVVYENVK
ncbi:MAG: hypothetical protein SVY15_02995 [Halobacteriota archaeon]|nr:hypothetical protein [Halobacteriota archaeon]